MALNPHLTSVHRASDLERIKRRFWDLVTKKRKDECWPYTGVRDKKGKYGQFRGFRPSRQAHRVAYMLEHDVVLPKEIVVHHTCHERKDHTPLCCNPRHLEEIDDVTHRSQHARARWAADKAGTKRFRKRTGM